MADATSLTTQGFRAQAWFNTYLRKVAEKGLFATPVLYELADKAPLPGGSGKQIYIPKHIPKNQIRALATGGEGKPLQPCGTSSGNYTATVAGYGDVRTYSDFLIAIQEVPKMVANDVEAMSIYAGQKIDSLIRAQMSANGTYVEPDGVVGSGSVASTTNLKQRFLFDARAILAGNSAPTYGDGMYAAVLHPRQTHDLFVSTSGERGQMVKLQEFSYMQTTEAGVRKIENHTIDRIAGCRIIESSYSAKAVRGAGGMSGRASGFQGYVLAPGAVGAVDLANSRLRTYTKGFGSAGTADAIDQVMSVGIKFYFAAVKMDTANRLIRTASGKTL